MKTDFEVFEKLSLNWAVVIVAVLVLMLLIRKITNGPKPKKHIKSHIVDNLYKSNLSIGKSNKKKRSKKQRTAEVRILFLFNLIFYLIISLHKLFTYKSIYCE